MRIPFGMNRAQREAYCGVRDTVYQRVLDILAPLLLVAAITVIGIRWNRLPDRIPTHYDLAGNIDGYGGRGTLLLMPILGLINDLILAACLRFPQSWSMGIRKTPQNAPYLYRATRTLFSELRFCMDGFFAAFGVYLSLAPDKLSSGALFAGTALIFLPLAPYIVKLVRIKKIS